MADRPPLRRHIVDDTRRSFAPSYAEIPARRRPVGVLFLLLLAVLVGCNNNRVMNPDEAPGQSKQDTTATAKTSADSSSHVPFDTTSNDQMASRGDSVRQSPLPDTTRAVPDEYSALDDTTQGFSRRPIETGPKPVAAEVRRTPEGFSDTVKNPVATFKGLTSAEMSSAGMAPTRTSPPPTNPVEAFKGLNRNELLSIPGYRPPTSAQKATRSPRPTSRTTTTAPQRREIPTARVPARNAGIGSPERAYIDGLAAERAGDYGKAVEQLGRSLTTLRSSAQRAEARYYYARSLEGLGRLDDAAEQYRLVSQGEGSLSHAALIDYCRTLGKLGKNERARDLVLQFLRRHPDSSQVPEAQRLLQTL